MYKTKKEIEEEKEIFISKTKKEYIENLINDFERNLSQSENFVLRRYVRPDLINDIYDYFTNLGFFCYIYTDLSSYKIIEVRFFPKEEKNNQDLNSNKNTNKFDKIKKLFKK